MLVALIRELPSQRRRLATALLLLLVEAVLATMSIAMLVPIGQAALDENEPIHVGGISLEWLPGVFTEGEDRVVWLLLLLGALLVIKVLAG
jgi:hypothetical protein